MSCKLLRSFADAEAALQPHIPIVQQMTGKDITLERMEPLMARLGNPERNLKVIHVAGTSGKTSTAYYVAGLLKAAGQTVGLTVSPHIDVISERVQINLEPLSEEAFCSALSEFLSLIEGIEPMPSYFELLMAMAYWYFNKIDLDYAVIETGFGGLHDASNICQRADKICVLTDIGFDHMHILGDTLPKISLQKAGIMHAGNQAFTLEQTKQVLDVFEGYAAKVGAELYVVNEEPSANIITNPAFTDLPVFQQRNWLLASEVFSYIVSRDMVPQLNAKQLQTALHTYIPGRMDIQRYKGHTIIMDGAHNEQKMAAFVRSFQKIYPGKTVPVMLGMKQGKEYASALPILKPITSSLIVTTFDINQDLRSRPIDPRIIAEEAKHSGFPSIIIETNPHIATERLLESDETMAIVTGSFYLLANVRRLMLKA